MDDAGALDGAETVECGSTSAYDCTDATNMIYARRVKFKPARISFFIVLYCIVLYCILSLFISLNGPKYFSFFLL